MPLAAYARWQATTSGDELVLEARLGDPNDASRAMLVQQRQVAVSNVEQARALGLAVAEALLAQGGRELLAGLDAH